MPQLMPLLWMFSSFMIFYMIIVMFIMYDSVYSSKYMQYVEKDLMIMKNMNWKW